MKKYLIALLVFLSLIIVAVFSFFRIQDSKPDSFLQTREVVLSTTDHFGIEESSHLTDTSEREKKDIAVSKEMEEEEQSVEYFDPEYPDLTPEEVSAIMHKIQAGDVSCVKSVDLPDADSFTGWRDDYELVIVDVNRDGYEDIVFRKKDEKPDYRVVTSIFSYADNIFQDVFEDNAPGPYFYLLSADNRLISARKSGDASTYAHSYFLLNYDEDWDKTYEYGMGELWFWDLSDLSEEWLEEKYPEIMSVTDIKEGDIYYLKSEYKNGTESTTVIDKGEFLRLFNEMTGFDYDSIY